MCLDRRNAALLGKVRSLLDVSDAGRARLPRNQADRERSLIKIPDFFPGSADDKRSRLNREFIESLSQSFGQLRLKIVNECLARWQSQIVDLGHGGISVLANANDQAKSQRLFAAVGGYGWSGLCYIGSAREVLRRKSNLQRSDCLRA